MRIFRRALPLCALAASLIVGTPLVTGAVQVPNVPSAAFARSLDVGPRLAQASLTSRVDKIPFSIRLEDQFLSDQRYLPLSFQPAGSAPTPTTTSTTTTTTTEPSTSTPTTSTSTTTSTTTTTTAPASTTTTLPAAQPVTKIVAGSFVFRFSSLPGALKSQWRVGTNNILITGALMRFQSDHGLPVTGNIDTTTWHAIVKDEILKRRDPLPYTNVLVNQAVPQSLKLYINGHVFFSTLVNTGINASPTENGTYPVYLRFTTTTMSGTQPDGKKYHDTGIPWVSYFHGGDALHGFLRSQYGYPQSLGCVEMTYAHAAIVWPHTPLGTLVSVE